MSSRKIVVIAPIRNESWILKEYLTAVSLFADHIVLGDHGSKDDSASIASRFNKVTLVDHEMATFSERERRNDLLLHARQFGSENLILSLDADEFLTPNLLTDGVLEELKNRPVGTRVSLPFLNVLPNLKGYWHVPQDPVGFIDDGSLHQHSELIHFPRVPLQEGASVDRPAGVGLLHVQYVDWKRMESKHRWYQAWETVNFPHKTPLEIYRRYHHMYSIKARSIKTLDPTWIPWYQSAGVDLESLRNPQKEYWWDTEVKKLVKTYGENTFRYLNLAPIGVQSVSRNGIEEWKVKAFRNYVRVTTAISGQSKWSPLRLFVRTLDLSIGPIF